MLPSNTRELMKRMFPKLSHYTNNKTNGQTRDNRQWTQMAQWDSVKQKAPFLHRHARKSDIKHKTSKHIRDVIVFEIGRLYVTLRVAHSFIVALWYGTNVCLQNQGTFMVEKSALDRVLCCPLNGQRPH